VVEGARLESVYARKGIEGSNPSLSAFARRSLSVGGLAPGSKSLVFRRASADEVRLLICPPKPKRRRVCVAETSV
jgi:hypothetical protein